MVEPGDEVKVKILEIDEERRRLSLSLKRVEGQVLERREVPPLEGQEAGQEEVGEVPDLGLSEEVFAPEGEPEAEAPEARRGRSAGRDGGDRRGTVQTAETAEEPIEAAAGRGGAGAGRRGRAPTRSPSRPPSRRPEEQT